MGRESGREGLGWRGGEGDMVRGKGREGDMVRGRGGEEGRVRGMGKELEGMRDWRKTRIRGRKRERGKRGREGDR